MSEPAFKVVIEGREHVAFEENGRGGPQPIRTMDDAKYWAGELEVQRGDQDQPFIATIVELATGRAVHLGTVATEWDRSGHPCAWAEIKSDSLDELKIRMRRASVAFSC